LALEPYVELLAIELLQFPFREHELRGADIADLK
jgi:hypothetical protein